MTAKKDFAKKSFPATVTFPSDLEQAVRDLQAQRQLSPLCQAAVAVLGHLEPRQAREMMRKAISLYGVDE
jgi:hypothetical protein